MQLLRPPPIPRHGLYASPTLAPGLILSDDLAHTATPPDARRAIGVVESSDGLTGYGLLNPTLLDDAALLCDADETLRTAGCRWSRSDAARTADSAQASAGEVGT